MGKPGARKKSRSRKKRKEDHPGKSRKGRSGKPGPVLGGGSNHDVIQAEPVQQEFAKIVTQSINQTIPPKPQATEPENQAVPQSTPIKRFCDWAKDLGDAIEAIGRVGIAAAFAVALFIHIFDFIDGMGIRHSPPHLKDPIKDSITIVTVKKPPRHSGKKRPAPPATENSPVEQAPVVPPTVAVPAQAPVESVPAREDQDEWVSPVEVC